MIALQIPRRNLFLFVFKKKKEKKMYDDQNEYLIIDFLFLFVREKGRERRSHFIINKVYGIYKTMKKDVFPSV